MFMGEVAKRVYLVCSQPIKKLIQILPEYNYDIIETYQQFCEFENGNITEFDLLILDYSYQNQLNKSELNFKLDKIGLIYIIDSDNLQKVVSNKEFYGNFSFIVRPYDEKSVVPVLENAIRHKNQRGKKYECLDEVCKNIEEGVLLLDSAGRIMYVNEQAAQVTGIKKIISSNNYYSETIEFRKIDNKEKKIDPIQKTLQENRDNSGEAILKSVEGYQFPINYYTSRLDLTGSEDKGLAFIFNDLREEKKQEDIRRGLEKRLQSTQKLEIIGSLTKNLANNFNNLLTPILALSSMEIEKLTPEQEYYTTFKQIINSAQLAKDLLKQLKLFSEEVEQQKNTIRLAETLEDTLPFIEKIVKTDVKIEKNIGVKEKQIYADVAQIHQLLVDISTYACEEISKHGGGKLIIELGKINANGKRENSLPLDYQQEYLVLSFIFKSDGTQVTKEEILESLTPLPDSQYLKEVGDYISIIQNIVDRNNGVLDIEESKNGSSVKIYFPTLENRAKINFAREKVELENYNKKNILLVEDEKSVRKVLNRVLERLDFNVTSVISGSEAIEKLENKSDKYDLILTDLKMPGMDGDSLAVKVKKIAHVPVLLITGYGGNISKDIKKHQAIDKIIFKPVSPSKVKKEISEVLEKYE